MIEEGRKGGKMRGEREGLGRTREKARETRDRMSLYILWTECDRKTEREKEN